MREMTPDVTDRFEALADLYYHKTGHMRPGKDSRTEDTSAPENRTRFDEWVASGNALTAALDRLVRTEAELAHRDQQIEELTRERDEARRMLVGNQGHGEPCGFCGRSCDGRAGNPGEWPIPLCLDQDNPGVVAWHHVACITERLRQRDDLRAKLESERETRGELGCDIAHLRAKLERLADAAERWREGGSESELLAAIADARRVAERMDEE